MPAVNSLRAARLRTTAAVATALLYPLVMGGLGRGHPAWAIVSYAIFIPLALLALWSFLAAARLAPDPAFRRGLWLYAASHGATAIGNVIWCWQQFLLGVDPSASWANLAYLLSYPLAIAGVLAFPVVRAGGESRGRLVVDAAIAIVGGCAITWLQVARPLAATPMSLLDRVITFTFPVGDMVIFAVMVPLLLERVGGAGRMLLPRLAVGQLLYLAGDLGYQLNATSPAWMPVDWPDLLFLGGYAVMIWAMEGVAAAPTDTPAVDPRAVRLPRNLLPLLLGVTVYLLLIREAARAGTTEVWVLAIVTVVVTLLILLREILTERQNVRLARALEVSRSEARFLQVIRHLTVGVVVQDDQARLRLANPAALDLLGRTEADLRLGTAFDPAWDVVHEDGAPFPEEAQPVRVAIASRKPVRNVVMGVYRPRTQDRAWVLVNADPSLRPDGTVEEVLCSFQDITERRALEDRLRHSQRMEAVGQLAGGVAHDFNNLLTAIIGYASLVQADLARGEARSEDVVEIRKAADRAAALTQQLLAFGRRQMLRPVLLDVNAVVHDAERLLARLLGEDIRIRTELAGGLGLVKVDRGQLEQVIVNLAVNARDAMPRGGTLTMRSRRVDPGSPGLPPGLEVPAGGGVLLSMADSGVGMDELTLGRAFEPFFTTKETGKGTGLGLSTVYGIVRQSGGDVRIESTPGRGTTVSVCLPLADGSAVPGEITPVPLSTGGRETILVVEDEEALLTVMQRALEGRGYRVHPASSPAAAREWLDRHRGALDLLLTDVVMPGGSGPELVAYARRARPGLPALFISGYADEATLRYGLDQENATLLPKPFHPEKLVAQVREVLDRAG
ncbi:MAG TPA: response regulator [Gemmatimonadales bacterium]|nr:response regulator [Gemmatimonadales bacterium]